MLSPTELAVAASASLGGIGLLWGNIKGIFARIESLIIVKTELAGNMEDDFLDYAWAHFKSSPLGVRKFYSSDEFIRPKNRVGRIATEHSAKFITFWKGWKPLFCSGGSENKTELTFIRGTFDIETLLIESVNFHDKQKHEKSSSGSRYYVKRCFGRKNTKTRDNQKEGSETVSKSEPSNPSSSIFGKRPLFYTKDQLGFPTSNKPMENLAYGESVTEFYEECVRWKNSKDWFKDKGLPWRFGAGLFGPPGTGKSSLGRALGQGLDLPIHSYDLTTMDNQELVENWQQSLSESPCIVLLEDIDRIFDENKQIKTANDKAPLTLDCLLNCISGVQPSDGILVLVTANDVTKLDPALGVPDSTGKSTRPGRLDRALYVGILTKEGREKIAKRILSDVPEMIEDTVFKGENETGAQFESRCSKIALEQHWGRFKVYGQNEPQATFSLSIPEGVQGIDEIRREGSYV